MSEVEGGLDGHIHFLCLVLNCVSADCKVEDQGLNTVHEQMEVEYHHTQSQNHPPAVGWLLSIQSFHCHCIRGK
jgi:hypothetical protein